MPPGIHHHPQWFSFGITWQPWMTWSASSCTMQIPPSTERSEMRMFATWATVEFLPLSPRQVEYTGYVLVVITNGQYAWTIFQEHVITCSSITLQAQPSTFQHAGYFSESCRSVEGKQVPHQIQVLTHCSWILTGSPLPALSFSRLFVKGVRKPQLFLTQQLWTQSWSHLDPT